MSETYTDTPEPEPLKLDDLIEAYRKVQASQVATPTFMVDCGELVRCFKLRDVPRPSNTHVAPSSRALPSTRSYRSV